jgi:hypothetical protein
VEGATPDLKAQVPKLIALLGNIAVIAAAFVRWQHWGMPRTTALAFVVGSVLLYLPYLLLAGVLWLAVARRRFVILFFIGVIASAAYGVWIDQHHVAGSYESGFDIVIILFQWLLTFLYLGCVFGLTEKRTQSSNHERR